MATESATVSCYGDRDCVRQKFLVNKLQIKEKLWSPYKKKLNQNIKT